MPSITIQGHEFEVPAPYAEGHVLTAGEASALNQTYAENLRNNFAKQVKDAGESPDLVDLQAKLDAYANEYEFGVRRSGGGTRVVVDAITREAINLAKDAIRAKAKSLNKKIDAETVTELAEQLVDKDPQFRALAEERVAQKKALASSSLESLGL
jgi:proline dehydrogenase